MSKLIDLVGAVELSPEKLAAIQARIEAEEERRIAENRLAHYVPYRRQGQFHAAGAKHRERLLIAANQSGKSLAGGMECAMHATGRYPEWWQGKRFDKPTIGWGAGTTNETTRDTVQRILVGRPGQPGTAAIPKDAIIDLVSARGTPDLLDSIKLRHVSGSVPVIGLKSTPADRWLVEALAFPPVGIAASCVHGAFHRVRKRLPALICGDKKRSRHRAPAA